MNILYLDVETIPANEETEVIVREQYQKIPDRSIPYEAYYERTSLNGNYGQIFCIAYAKNDSPTKVLQGDEAEILREFWQIAKSVDRFVGHHILEFDLPFIMKRSRAHAISPTRQFPWPQIRSGVETTLVFDTKKEWECWAGGSGSGLDTLAKILGFPTSKQGIDGSQVYDFYRAGRYAEIYAYCARDVELTRTIYQRLNEYADKI